MQAIIVSSEDVAEGVTLNSYDRAKAISRELYNITRPVQLQTEREMHHNVFPVIQHPETGAGAMLINPMQMIPVHPLATIERLSALFPELTPEEKLKLSGFALTQTAFPFAALIPSGTEVRNEAYMVEHGWISE